MRTTEDCIRIAAAGGGLDLRSTAKTTEDLIRIAGAASSKMARILINGKVKTTEDLIRIGAAGKGCVLFSFD